jgi:phosphoenolpyruvate carboxykinase (ATP)
LHPTKYAELLGEKLKKHKVNVWLLNTGWVGGKFGIGSRITLITAALNGELDHVDYGRTPYFGLYFPKACPGVPTEILEPQNAWKDKELFKATAQNLANLFVKNFEQYAPAASEAILSAAPRVQAIA